MHKPFVSRRQFLRLAGGVALTSMLCSTGLAVGKKSARPNILFIMVDDLGWSDLGCYGSDLHETKNIDKLASQAVMFTDAYSSSPVCSPTRASVLSGKHPARINMTVWREAAKRPAWACQGELLPPITEDSLSLEEITYAERLKQKGYLTAHIGKWHVGDFAHFPENHGFDINVGASIWGAPPTYFYPYKGIIYDEPRFIPDLAKNEDGQYFTDRKGEYLTDRLTDEAMEIMEQAGDRPFFLNLCYHTVHTPIEGKKKYVEYYKKKIKQGMNHRNAKYAAMVKSLDDNVGRVLTKLKKLNIEDNTLVIFCSDNGGQINKWDGQTVTNNSPLRSGKGGLYEGGIRVPLIIRWPDNAKQNGKCSEPVISMDLYATICEVAKVDYDKTKIDGKSLINLLKSTDSGLGRQYLCWHYPHYYTNITSPVSAIRCGDFKLLKYYEDNHVELYNIKQDLSEQNDLSEKLIDKKDALLKKLNAWCKQVNAQMPEVNPDYKK